MTDNKKGIKPKDAIAILFERSKVTNSVKDEMKPELKNLGQTLDLLPSPEPTKPQEEPPSSPLSPSPVPNETDQQGKASKLKLELEGKSPSQLLQRLFQIQQERVSTYAEFNSGLETVLQSGNITHYPHLTATITAKFSILSKSIRDIQDLLKNTTNPDVQSAESFVKQLQELEKDKLNLTAALHLDQMRERNERLGAELQEKDGGDVDGRIATLLQESVQSLNSRIGDCVEKINEVLEELRYISADLESVC